MTLQRDAQIAVAQVVRRMYPLRYVRVKPHSVDLVQMQRGRGPWLLYTVDDALATKREWRQRSLRKRKPPTKVKR